MEHTYESEVLYKLMERDGLNIPSSVPPYESEIKAYLIEQVKLAYPKLNDYEAEWLLYNYTKYLPAEFPIETITNVNNATVDNVVPYAYKSAILKGQTLVNLFDRNYLTTESLSYTFNNGIYSIASTVPWSKLFFKVNLKNNTKYIFFGTTSVADCEVYYRIDGGASKICNFNQFPFIFTTPVNEIDSISIGFPSIVTDATVSYLMLNEYQDGMENWDIPYFEGMQSVKMPVLTTSNEDGTKTNILTVNEDVELRGIGDVRDTLDLISGEIIESIGEGVLNGSEEWIFNAPKEQLNHWCFHNQQKLADEKLLISDRFPQSDIDGNRESIRGGGDFIFVYISKEKVEGDANSFKQWLSQNPIKYQYRKSEKSVKTVDLSITDESGNEINHFMPIEGTMHIQTDGEPVRPSVTMEIPVEATTQNLASFIEMGYNNE